MSTKVIDLNISSLISDSWKVFKKNWKLLVQAMVVSLLVASLPNIYRSVFGDGFLTAIIPLISMVINMVISVGWMKMLLKMTGGDSAELADLWSHTDQIIPYAVGSFVVSLIVGIGMIFFVIPGIYFALKYIFVPYLIVDKKLKVGEAFAASAKMTKGIKWQLLVMGLAVLVLNIVGLLAFIVGIIITSMVTSLAYVKLYQQVSKSVK